MKDQIYKKMTRFQKSLIFSLIILIVTIIGGYLVKSRDGKVAGTQSEQKEVRGIILPHHNLAENLILESFEKLKSENYSYVVILGPNHFAPNVNSLITAKEIPGYSFENEIMNSVLQKYPDISQSPDLVEKEHSLTIHLPFIKNYFPEAKILPLMISPFSGNEDLSDKISYLASTVPSDTLFIASVDFAHDVLPELGFKNNQESISAISEFNYQTLTSFDDTHMDSPLSILALLYSMQKFGSTGWETWYSSHASLIENDPGVQGTSYVIGVFR